MKNFLTTRLCASLLALGIFAVRSLAAEVVPVLQTKTETYQNVTVISQTETHVFVQHSRGVATLKQTDLDAQAMAQLGIKASSAVERASEGEAATGDAQKAGEAASTSDFFSRLREHLPAGIPSLSKNLWLLILGGVLLLYVFYIFTVKLICEKTGVQLGWWVWVPLPIVQKSALLKAAGMSWFWLLTTIICNALLRHIDPDRMRTAYWAVILSGAALLVTEHILWSVKISGARGKGVLTMLFLIFPLTYPFAYLYLAFSGAADATDAEPSAT